MEGRGGEDETDLDRGTEEGLIGCSEKVSVSFIVCVMYTAVVI